MHPFAHVFLLPVTGTPNLYDRQVTADAPLHDGQDLATCLDSPVPKVPGSDGTEGTVVTWHL